MHYYIKKIATLLITIILISIFSFVLFQIVPGDPALALLGTEAEEGQLELIRENLGLELPIHLRYLNWIGDVLKGDMGESIRFSKPVSELISNTLPVTLSLGVISMGIAILFAIPLGIISARNQGELKDRTITLLSQIGMSIPSFWVGIILIFIFGLKLRWFKPGGYAPFSEDLLAGIMSLILPAIAIAIPCIATIIRYLRTSMIEQMNLDYVRTAYGKGLKGNMVIYRHILKNAMIPVVTIMGMIMTSIIGGSLIVEQVFSIPGIGRLLILSIQSRDYYLIQGIVMYIALAVAIINLLIDVVYTKLDPRIVIK